jgi:hypothetical protein
MCHLQLLLVLASAVILRSEFRGTHDRILLSQIRDTPTWRPRFPYLYTPGREWSSYTPSHWVPFSSPPTTRRAAVEVFIPASTRERMQGVTNCPLTRLVYNISARNGQETPFLCCYTFVACAVIGADHAEITIPPCFCSQDNT